MVGQWRGVRDISGRGFGGVPESLTYLLHCGVWDGWVCDAVEAKDESVQLVGEVDRVPRV